MKKLSWCLFILSYFLSTLPKKENFVILLIRTEVDKGTITDMSLGILKQDIIFFFIGLYFSGHAYSEKKHSCRCCNV